MAPPTTHAVTHALGASSPFDDVLGAVLTVFPEHRDFLQRSYDLRSQQELEDTALLAKLISAVAGDQLLRFCEHYRWMCNEMVECDLQFRRTGEYRFKRVSDVIEFCYGNPDYMSKYVDGILVSQLFWLNHLRAFSLLRRRFFPQAPDQYRHLEVGPGHGLLLYLAASDPRCSSATGYDISATSLAKTRECLTKLDVRRPVTLEERDVAIPVASTDRTFDTIVISEVLEHLEDPAAVLRNLRGVLSPNGRIFVNVPINSPAPDHIFLLRTAEEARSLVTSAGLRLCESYELPLTGYTLERARTLGVTVTCVVIAENAA